MIIGYSFSKGISLNVVNQGVEANLFGHFMVNMMEKNGQAGMAIIRDRDKMVTTIKERLENIGDVREALIARVFAVGNRQGRILSLTGFAEPYENMLKALTLLEGDFTGFKNGEVENPLILARHLAESLNVRVGDNVRIRLNTIYGQIQTARLNLIAIVKIENPLLFFMRKSCFLVDSPPSNHRDENFVTHLKEFLKSHVPAAHSQNRLFTFQVCTRKRGAYFFCFP